MPGAFFIPQNFSQLKDVSFTSLTAGDIPVFSGSTWQNQTGKFTQTFVNNAARSAAVPAFAGQVGVQIDSGALYRATGTSAGNWTGIWAITETTGAWTATVQTSATSASLIAVDSTTQWESYFSASIGGFVISTGDPINDLGVDIVGAQNTLVIRDSTFGSGVIVTLGGDPTASELRFLEPSGSGSNYTGLKTVAQSASITYTFPTAGPASNGYVLSCTTGGALSWVAAASAAITINSTVISGGTSGRILYDNAGTVGEITLPLGYAQGGTNAITQSAARINLGGERYFTSGVAMAAAAPDAIGQLLSFYDTGGGGTDTAALHIAYGTSAGQTVLLYDWNEALNRAYLPYNLLISGTLTGVTRLAANTTAAAGGEHQLEATGAFVDGVLELWNGTGGSSAVAIFDPDAASMAGGAAAFGWQPVASSSDYAGVPHISTNPAGGVGAGVPFGIWIEENISAAGYLAHRRLYFDNSNIRLYGVTAASAVGPIGVDVNAAGNVALAPTSAGTVTIGGGATASTLRIMEPSGSGTNYVEQTVGALAANRTATWPDKSGTVAMVGDGANNITAGRLTLTSATPVLTSSVSGAGTVYFTPFRGNAIALYDGAAWNVRTFTELSITLSTLSASTVYDVFAYDNAGTVALDTTAWTNATTRATALVFQDGVYVKSGALTRRYLGSIILDGSKQCSVDFGSFDTGGAQAAQIDIWNYNNRVRGSLLVGDTADSWASSGTSLRAANGSNSNRATLLVGVVEDTVSARVDATATSVGANQRLVAIGLDSTSAAVSTSNFSSAIAPIPMTASWEGYPGVGQHYLQWLERIVSSTGTFYGDNGGVSQSGLSVTFQY